MSTVDKAAYLIGQDLYEPPTWRPRRLATNLDKAGLLAPDLPKPEIEYTDGGACWLDGENTSVEYHHDSDSDACITTGVAYDLTPTEAKHLALTLLAAAKHAEVKAREMTNG